MEAAVGFESLEEETRIDSLPVEGEIPSWLTGALLRTGPAKYEVGERTMNHWFDGFAMLHRFAFDDGRVSYANRFLESKAYRAAEETGELSYSEFATDPCRSLFKRAVSMFQPPNLTDNGNVNLVKLGERFVTMTETPIAVEFDGETLETAGVAWDVPGMLTTAHPHLDRDTGGMINYAVKLGPRNEYRFFRLRPDGKRGDEEVVASMPTREPAYLHSFGMTERWIVHVEFPYVVNPLSLALSGRPFIENFKWKPELGTRFNLIDRSSGEVSGPFTADPVFCFHHVNAYDEEDGTVVVDLCALDDPQIVKSLYLGNLRAGGAIPPAFLTRFTISPDTGAVESERLIDEPFELPRINYGRCHERPYRYAWGCGSDGEGFFDRLVGADVRERTSKVWREPGCSPGEPVFVAAPGGSGEADGVLLSVVLDAQRETSFLVVLDAGTMNEVGRASVPHHIPFGFHGQYAAA